MRKLTKPELLAVLDDIRAHVAADDSFEGSLEYSWLDDGLPKGRVRVDSAYRIGNREGQGGMRIV